jgi:hypothetical protein
LNFGILNVAMLAGLAAVALPVIIHLLSRRRDPVIDWGAMQFLEFGPRSRRRINLADTLLMLARMALIGLVALALARPFWKPGANASTGSIGSTAGVRRDVVLILDGSTSMGRRVGDATPRDRAIAWAKGFVQGLGPGDSVAVLVAKDRVRPLVDPPSFDKAKVVEALAKAPPARGSSDLSAAVAEAFRLLEKPGNPARDVIILTDGQRSAWRPGEPARWALLRELRGHLPVPPRIWSLDFGRAVRGTAETGPDGSVVGLEISRAAIVPGLPLTLTATVANAGPGPLSRPIELLVDGRVAPGTGQVVGPIPPGGRTNATFRLTLDDPGSHLLTARLGPADDPLPGDDELSRPVEVVSALPALLVDGEPSREPLGGETDFLRIALAPRGDDAPTIKTTVIDSKAITPDAFKNQRVIVLANVDQIAPALLAAIEEFVSSGGGLLIAPGDRTESNFAADAAWLPAALGETKGNVARRQAVAHPAPRTFSGPALGPLGQGESPALAEADLFAYRVLEPRDGSTVLARLDTGDPWVVERPHGRGRVILLASALDAEAGTLPVNPDFVPLAHELILHLGAGSTASAGVRPGEPIVFDLPGAVVPAGTTLVLLTPDGTTIRVPAVRSDNSTRVRVSDTSMAGVYRLTRPNPPGGYVYALVTSDPREADPTSLEPAEASKLAEGWPLAFEPDPAALPTRIATGDASPRREVWRWLIFAALGGLCLEVWMTRRMAVSRGLV